MKRGQKIARESMSSEDIARVNMSNWLVLHLIGQNPGITAKGILRGLKKSLKTINEEKPDFFLMFAGYDEYRNYYVYSLDDILGKYEMEALISVSEDRKKYYLSNCGAKIVLDGICNSFLSRMIWRTRRREVQSLVNGEKNVK